MPTITITNTNIAPNTNTFKMRQRLVTGGVWSSYYTISAIPFAFVSPHPIDSNYELEIYQDCGTSQSTSTFFTSNFVPTCNIVGVANLVISPCDINTNTYSITFDVTYTGMKSDTGLITSVFDIVIDGTTYFVNPNNVSGTQTITISGLTSDGLSHSLSISCKSSSP